MSINHPTKRWNGLRRRNQLELRSEGAVSLIEGIHQSWIFFLYISKASLTFRNPSPTSAEAAPHLSGNSCALPLSFAKFFARLEEVNNFLVLIY
jgi:hypothetical protein